LTLVRNVDQAQYSRYGYTASNNDLTLVVDSSGAAGVAIHYAPAPQVTVLTAYLGGAAQFAPLSHEGTLTAGTTDSYAFNLAASELQSTTSGVVYLGVEVQSDVGGLFQPGVPSIDGLTPVVTGRESVVRLLYLL